jgi:hypothetical protein
MFIKLTESKSGKPMLVNSDRIISAFAIQDSEGNPEFFEDFIGKTHLVMESGGVIVDETPEELYDLVAE